MAVITIRSRQHAAAVFKHLREARGLARTDLARLLFVSAKTIANREQGAAGISTETLIDTARALGLSVELVTIVRAGRRPTGTGWPDDLALIPRTDRRPA